MPGRHLAAPKRRTVGQRLMLALGVVLSVLLFGAAAVLGYLNDRFSDIIRFDVGVDVPSDPGEPRNYLIVGTDSRAGLDPDDPQNGGFFGDGITENDAKRTDTIMVLRVDPGEGTASLLSFNRDLWVDIAGDYGSNRINTAFLHGEDVLMNTIRDNFQIPIHHYIEVNLLGFLRLVEAIDGVPFYFDSALSDSKLGTIAATPGCHVLDPREALAFARARHLTIQNLETGSWYSDPTGDYGRVSRQQAFVRAAMSRALSKGLSNPVTLNELVGVGVENVGLDSSLEPSDIIDLARQFASFDADALDTYSLPSTPFRTSAGADVVDLDEAAAEPILNIFRGVDSDELTPGLVTVTVKNGTASEELGLAGDISAGFEEIGFHTGEPADTPEPVSETTILFPPGGEGVAAYVARYLTEEATFEVDANLAPGSVELWVGDDFTTLHEQPSPTIPEVTTTTSTATTDPSTGDTVATTTTTTLPVTTTTEPPGYVPEEPPPGSDCN